MAPGSAFRGPRQRIGDERMIRRLRAILAAGVLAATAPAWADQPYGDVFFVRPSATAAALFAEREQCSREAAGVGSNAAGYSNPEYGALSAMGSALDENQLHEGGIHKRMRRAILVDCMKRMGWTPQDPAPDEAKALAKASPHHPQVLDAWLQAHEPAPPPSTAPTPAPAPKP